MINKESKANGLEMKGYVEAANASEDKKNTDMIVWVLVMKFKFKKTNLHRISISKKYFWLIIY